MITMGRIERNMRKMEMPKIINKHSTGETRIGIKQQIPIILTEHSVDERILERVKIECGSNVYYHKFIIDDANSYDRDYILQTVKEFFLPSSLMPVHFTQTQDITYFLARDCLDVILKMIAQRFQIPHSLNPTKPFKVVILANYIASEVLPFRNIDNNIPKVMEKRFNPESKTLNLNNISEDLDLNQDSELFAMKNFQKLMTNAALMAPKIVNLRNNHLKDIYHLYLLKNSLEVLDLSNNNLKTIKKMRVLYQLTNLKSLSLTGNPICELYNSYNYVIEFKGFCPKLEILDGINITTPQFRKNFQCSDEAEDLITQFVEHFFTVYDSSNRMDLKDMYDPNAIFSVNSKITKNQKSSSTVRLSHYGLENPYAVYGIVEIMKLFEEFPKTTHDPYPMVSDVTMYSDTHAHLVVCGIFREHNNQLLSFNRSFYFRHHDDHFFIVNDQLHVSNALDCQSEWSFAFPADVKITGAPLPYFYGQYSEMERVLQKLTNMNLEYCQRYLVYCNYDLKKVLTLFSELYARNEISKEAFEYRREQRTDSRKRLCEPLVEKVFSKHKAVTAKTIWKTLNDSRMESYSDLHIPVNLGVNKLYRRSNKAATTSPSLQITTKTNEFVNLDYREFENFVEVKSSTSSNHAQSPTMAHSNKTSKDPPPSSHITQNKEKTPSTETYRDPLLEHANQMARYKDTALRQTGKLEVESDFLENKPSTSGSENQGPEPTTAVVQCSPNPSTSRAEMEMCQLPEKIADIIVETKTTGAKWSLEVTKALQSLRPPDQPYTRIRRKIIASDGRFVRVWLPSINKIEDPQDSTISSTVSDRATKSHNITESPSLDCCKRVKLDVAEKSDIAIEKKPSRKRKRKIKENGQPLDNISQIKTEEPTQILKDDEGRKENSSDSNNTIEENLTDEAEIEDNKTVVEKEETVAIPQPDFSKILMIRISALPDKYFASAKTVNPDAHVAESSSKMNEDKLYPKKKLRIILTPAKTRISAKDSTTTIKERSGKCDDGAADIKTKVKCLDSPSVNTKPKLNLVKTNSKLVYPTSKIETLEPKTSITLKDCTEHSHTGEPKSKTNSFSDIGVDEHKNEKIPATISISTKEPTVAISENISSIVPLSKVGKKAKKVPLTSPTGVSTKKPRKAALNKDQIETKRNNITQKDGKERDVSQTISPMKGSKSENPIKQNKKKGKYEGSTEPEAILNKSSTQAGQSNPIVKHNKMPGKISPTNASQNTVSPKKRTETSSPSTEKSLKRVPSLPTDVSAKNLLTKGEKTSKGSLPTNSISTNISTKEPTETSTPDNERTSGRVTPHQTNISTSEPIGKQNRSKSIRASAVESSPKYGKPPKNEAPTNSPQIIVPPEETSGKSSAKGETSTKIPPSPNVSTEEAIAKLTVKDENAIEKVPTKNLSNTTVPTKNSSGIINSTKNDGKEDIEVLNIGSSSDDGKVQTELFNLDVNDGGNGSDSSDLFNLEFLDD